MQRFMLQSKLHRATVTEADLTYEGSITVDEALMETVDLIPHEMVHIYNISNGERFETYILKGKKNSGEICVNGAAARKVSVGDLVIIANYGLMADDEARKHSPRIALLDSQNRIKKRLQHVSSVS